MNRFKFVVAAQAAIHASFLTFDVDVHRRRRATRASSQERSFMLAWMAACAAMTFWGRCEKIDPCRRSKGTPASGEEGTP